MFSRFACPLRKIRTSPRNVMFVCHFIFLYKVLLKGLREKECCYFISQLAVRQTTLSGDNSQSCPAQKQTNVLDNKRTLYYPTISHH